MLYYSFICHFKISVISRKYFHCLSDGAVFGQNSKGIFIEKYRSPLHAIRCCSETIMKQLFHKKIEFLEMWQNTSTHYSSSTIVFAKIENILYHSEKSTLCLLRDCLSWWITFYTLFAFPTSFVSFHRCLRVVCSRLDDWFILYTGQITNSI